MVDDLYADAASLKSKLDAQGYESWATQLEDILVGGSTGTEIVLGLRWITAELQKIEKLDQSTKDLVKPIHSNAQNLLK